MKNCRKALIFIIFCLTVCYTYAADRRFDKSQLIIMTLNAEFLWDGLEPEEGNSNFAWKNSPSEALEHMEDIANIIKAVNPDIVNLVEVENLDALKTLNEKYLASMQYNAYLEKGIDIETGQDVGLLTRIDPENDQIKRYGEKGKSGNIEKSVSKNYYAKFTINNSKIALLGLHFRAFPLRQDLIHIRQAQADAIRTKAIELNENGYMIVVLGDFNDYDGDAENMDHIDSAPITDVLNMLKDLDPTNASDDLMNVNRFVPKGERYTAFYDQNNNGQVDSPEELTSIDHILISNDLVNKLHYAEIVHLPFHDPRYLSDHFPVVVCLKLDSQTTAIDGNLKIINLFPNPAGNENIKESITIKSFSTTVINLTGWILQDEAQRIWRLDELETITPNQKRTIERNEKPMALNNNGDIIYLIDPQGKIVHTVRYSATAEGDTVHVRN